MGTKPVLAWAGAVLAGVALSGCESSRSYYEGGRSYPSGAMTAYPPARGPASGTYAQTQAPAYYPPPRSMNPSAGMNANPAAYSTPSMKPEPMTEHSSTPIDVTSSVQFVNGPNTSGNSTPMMTITMPAVKFMVPISGMMATSNSGNVTMTATPTPDAPPPANMMEPMHNPALENQVVQTALQGDSMNNAYAVPPQQGPALPTMYTRPTSSPTMNGGSQSAPAMNTGMNPSMMPSNQYAAEAPTTTPNVVFSMPANGPASNGAMMNGSYPASAAPMNRGYTDDGMSRRPSADTAPPPPNWPRTSGADDGSMSDRTPPPPPPPPFRRNSSYPGSGGQTQYYQQQAHE